MNLLFATDVLAQNLVVNGSMTSPDGEFVVAPGWTAISRPFPVNTPDINDDTGPLNSTPGYEWTGGAPQPSPDGGSWQNVFWIESFSQTISGLTPGKTYHFSYYYSTQGIRERSSNMSYTKLAVPHLTVTGASGYTDPAVAGTLYNWNMYETTIVATSSTVTLTFSAAIDSYIAYDGIYLSPVPQNLPVITNEPETITACENGNISFQVTATNATTFQWQQNQGYGWYDINDDAIFSGTQSNTINIVNAHAALDNFRYQCVIKNGCCHVTTKPVTLTVTTPTAPAITISTASEEICAGPVHTFNGHPFNGGNNPVYQWFVNDLPAGTNSSTFKSSAIRDQDVISCRLTSNSGCKTAGTAMSNVIAMKVHSMLVADVSIVASADNICEGQKVIFTSSGTNEGLLPEFIWTKNGVIVGNASPEYIDNNLSDNDLIQCTLYSSEMCLSDYTVASNQLTIKVKPSGALNANITVNVSDLCEGSLATFHASSNYSGPYIEYAWKKNGATVANDAGTFSYAPSSSNDRINCIISADDACLTNGEAISNTITPVVHPLPKPSLDKNNALCAGSTRTLDAGGYRDFFWNNGSTAQKMDVSQTGKYFVRVTDAFGCSGSDTVIIDRILALPHGYLPNDTSKCLYGVVELIPLGNYKRYNWSTSSVDRTVKVKDPGPYWLEVTDENNCTGRDSVQIVLKQCKIGFYAPNAFTPNNDGKNDHFMPVLEGNILRYEFKIFNRWGQIVFTSSDPLNGWKGTIKGLNADANTYAWICIYQLEEEPVQVRKGTVVLLR